MYTIIYDVTKAPLVWPWIAFLLSFAMVSACGLLGQYLSVRRAVARNVLYGFVGLLFIAAISITAWSGVERRASCVDALESGLAQSVEGRLESFERVLIPGKRDLKETRFTVAGKSFVEPNISNQPCGFATRFTDAAKPEVGSLIRIWFSGDMVLRVEQKQ